MESLDRNTIKSHYSKITDFEKNFQRNREISHSELINMPKKRPRKALVEIASNLTVAKDF